METKSIIIILLMAIINNPIFSQTVLQLEKLENSYEKRFMTIKPDHLEYIDQDETKEVKIVGGLLFRVYKSFFSSQDYSSCSFTPSCSEYALEAIGKKGFLLGSIIFFDRFSRCNALSPEKYEVDPEKHLLYDPL